MADKKFKFITTDKAILHGVSVEVDKDEVSTLSNKLGTAFMLCGKKAAGISAVQLGIHKRACIVKLDDTKLFMFNPVVVEENGEQMEHIEGCLSIPFKKFIVYRNPDIMVEYMDKNWNKVKVHLIGAAAFTVLHEIDHMDGTLISDIGADLAEAKKLDQQLIAEQEEKEKSAEEE